VTDYALHGDGLNDKNIVKFFTDTYDRSLHNDNAGETSVDMDSPLANCRARRRHTRIPDQPQHPRTDHRNILPNFIGRYFPRNDDRDEYPFYSASVLLLLKPWRDVRTDLKNDDEDWAHAFQKFKENADRKILDILSNIEYCYESKPSSVGLTNALDNSNA
jgi:hypothetical protein